MTIENAPLSEILSEPVKARPPLPKKASATKNWLQSKGLWRAESALVGGALVFATFGGILQKTNQTAFERKIKNEFSIDTILVTTGQIPSGTLLKREHFTTNDILSGARTANMLSADEASKMIGRALEVNLGKGDPFLLSFVGSSLSDGGIASKIPPGKRLFTLSIEDVNAQSGFIRAGDFVDVISTMNLPGRGSTTFTLLTRLQLSAVGKSFDSNTQSASTQVSFFVTPQEMEILKQAQVNGSFSLSLRNPTDTDTKAVSKGVTLKDVFLQDGFYEKAEIPVEIHNGTKSEKGTKK